MVRPLCSLQGVLAPAVVGLFAVLTWAYWGCIPGPGGLSGGQRLLWFCGTAQGRQPPFSPLAYYFHCYPCCFLKVFTHFQAILMGNMNQIQQGWSGFCFVLSFGTTPGGALRPLPSQCSGIRPGSPEQTLHSGPVTPLHFLLLPVLS